MSLAGGMSLSSAKMPVPNSSGPAEGSPYSRHLPSLDGVRGIAVLGVMASHVFPGNATGVARLAQMSFNFGANGVDLFFVLSGFLITGILFDTLGDQRFFRKFYARRVLRIFPLYYAVLLVYLLADRWSGVPDGASMLSYALYLQNTQLLPINGEHPPLGHFWSLAIEEQFYLVWPLLVYLLRDRKRLIALCGAAMVALPIVRCVLQLHGLPYMVVHTMMALRADSLLCGGGLALLLRSAWHDRTLRAAPWVFAVSAGLLALTAVQIVVHLSAVQTAVIQAFGYTLLALISAAVIAIAVRPGWLQRVLRLPVLRTLGKCSYGLYVLHILVMRYTQMPLKGLLERHLGKGVSVVLTAFVVLALSFVAAWLSFNLYERQFLRLKRFFDYRRHPDTVGA